MTIDEFEQITEKIVAGLPERLFENLNGGILILPNIMESPHSKNNDLLVLGRYCRNASMGRYIELYYGSFIKMYAEPPKTKIEETIKHELRHHIESLAGERDLEIEDEKFIKNYLERVRSK